MKASTVFVGIALIGFAALFNNVKAATNYGDHCEVTYQCNYGDRRQMWTCADNKCVCSRWYIRDVDPNGREFCRPAPADYPMYPLPQRPPAHPIPPQPMTDAASVPVSATFAIISIAYLFY